MATYGLFLMLLATGVGALHVGGRLGGESHAHLGMQIHEAAADPLILPDDPAINSIDYNWKKSTGSLSDSSREQDQSIPLKKGSKQIEQGSRPMMEAEEDEEFERQLLLADTLAEAEKGPKFAESMSGETGLEPVIPQKKHFRLLQDIGKKTRAIDPMIVVAIAVSVLILLMLVSYAVHKNKGGDSFNAFIECSSSSSGNSSENGAGSTDKELQNRMERFEKRLESHKKLMETKSQESRASIRGTELQVQTRASLKDKEGWFERKASKEPATDAEP